jgi:hypothetical protein
MLNMTSKVKRARGSKIAPKIKDKGIKRGFQVFSVVITLDSRFCRMDEIVKFFARPSSASVTV